MRIYYVLTLVGTLVRFEVGLYRMVKGHKHVIVKRAVIGSKGGWKLSTIFLSCKVFHDWSIMKLRKYIVFIRQVYLCCSF